MVNQVAEKQKMGYWGVDFGGWQGGSLIDGVIQLVCSSWAKKMIILRLKSGGMGLFNDLFVCIVNWRVLCPYMLDGACMWLGLKFAGFVIAKFRKLRETNDNGWLRCRFGKWGSVGNAFVLLFESSYVLGYVDSFALYSSICASKRIFFIDDENISKILRIIYVLRWIVGLLVYVLRFLVMRKEIQ